MIATAPDVMPARTEAVRSQPLETIKAMLEEKRGNQSHSELARQSGISRPMLRCLYLYNTQPGLEVLSILVDWEPSFIPVVMEYMKERGQLLRTRNALTRGNG